MGTTGFVDVEQAHGLLASMMTELDGLNEFCRIGGDDLLAVAQKLELVSRRVFGVQVKIADEIDGQQLAASRSCTSTAALLRQVLNITPGEANARVRAAKALIPQDLPTGGEKPPVLPLLAAAVAQGAVDSEHVRVILMSQKRLPGKLDGAARSGAEKLLVETARVTDARDLQAVADAMENAINPDGTLHDSNPYDRMELFIGRRNKATGLTNVRGRLDDVAVELLYRAVDGYTKPRPGYQTAQPESHLVDQLPDRQSGSPTCQSAEETKTEGSETSDSSALISVQVGWDCTASSGPDLRSGPTRLAHGLVEALTTLLNAAILPTQAGERPHVTIVMGWDLVSDRICDARLAGGAYLTPAEARQILCDAQITPAILGSNSEVLDLGRTQRTFSPAIRKALVLRDGGCAWPGCPRPPAWTDSHHINYWQRDLGATSLSNGVLLCQRHHTEIHKNEWKIEMAEDGHPDFIAPAWLNKLQNPQRNILHHNTNQRQ